MTKAARCPETAFAIDEPMHCTLPAGHEGAHEWEWDRPPIPRREGEDVLSWLKRDLAAARGLPQDVYFVRPIAQGEEQKLVCRHTALEPVDVRHRGDGYFIVVRAKCANCGLELSVPRS